MIKHLESREFFINTEHPVLGKSDINRVTILFQRYPQGELQRGAVAGTAQPICLW